MVLRPARHHPHDPARQLISLELALLPIQEALEVQRCVGAAARMEGTPKLTIDLPRANDDAEVASHRPRLILPTSPPRCRRSGRLAQR